MESTSALLALPQELRDEIYGYILKERAEPPVSPSDPGVRIIESTLRYQTSEQMCRWWAPPLASANRQVRLEIHDYILRQRKSTHKRAVELDLMFNGGILWPTWLYVPAEIVAGLPLDLNIQLRISSTESFEEWERVPFRPDALYRSAFDAPFSDLLQLTKRFVRFGPTFHRMPSKGCSNLNSTGSSDDGRGLFKIRTLFVGFTFVSELKDYPVVRRTTKSLKRLARSGLARGSIDRVLVYSQYSNGHGDIINRENLLEVYQKFNEKKMQRIAVYWNLCHANKETLADGPLD